ncbi:hypothetical protein THMIRHAS_08060 [Thiosulfatimonas sediminis]|uniref:DUF3322 and DUF2220 domain-containing protein n=1 Tax=Thiosulfatimonas sediminis TaxID=2675054 RepID=A0A6F8PTH0_9GAMM|nr:DUF3322 domain-containing protein [Thiosulfatimonas sediminis]BBP45433.1 hypothetical protein THMIRHAS_08060 [Thiosulfatimonas sediminis]
MISVAQLKADLLQKWPRLYLSCGLVDEAQRFPLRVTLKSPNNQTILDDWQSVKSWAASYAVLNPTDFKLEWQTRKTPLGKQELPVAAVFSTVIDLARFLKKHQELTTYCNACQALIQRFPALLSWCLKSTAKVLQEHAHWHKLIQVLQWLVEHPAPNCFVREIALSDIDSKFIEAHYTLLNEWLLLLRPPLDAQAKGFERRWGLKSKPERLRLRFLGMQSICGLKDLQVPFIELNRINWSALGVDRVFITENEINFLSFPSQENSVILFGQGYGFDAWRDQNWLKNLPIFYWGDIDTHGFAILNQLRVLFPRKRQFTHTLVF